MTANSSSPRKESQRVANLGRRVSQQQCTCSWILLAFLPFLVVRLYFLYLSSDLPFVTRSDGTVGDVSSIRNTSQIVGNEKPETRTMANGPTLAEKSLENENVSRDSEEMEKEMEAAMKAGEEDDQVDDGKGNMNKSQHLVAGKCDLYDGTWVRDPSGPLYSNSTCFYIQRDQDCLRNGRPDKDYMYWRWKPRGCESERFNAHSFLHAWRGKKLGFVGDSLTRNQMQSLLCMLSQAEIPSRTQHEDNDRKVRWFFPTYSFTLITAWAPYLLKETTEEINGYRAGISKLYLDVLDESWTTVFKEFDVAVVSVGQWFYKSSLYLKNDKVVGCHYCPQFNFTELGFLDTYKVAIQLALEKIRTTSEFKGITVLTSFALDHFENGRWDNGGTCSSTTPLETGDSLLNGTINGQMYDVVMGEYKNALELYNSSGRDTSLLRLLDVSRLSLLRADGHPGHYRPFSMNDAGFEQNDCLHWCLPGPIDTWNEILARILENS